MSITGSVGTPLINDHAPVRWTDKETRSSGDRTDLSSEGRFLQDPGPPSENPSARGTAWRGASRERAHSRSGYRVIAPVPAAGYPAKGQPGAGATRGRECRLLGR